jgi:hypothetical protein
LPGAVVAVAAEVLIELVETIVTNGPAAAIPRSSAAVVGWNRSSWDVADGLGCHLGVQIVGALE